MSITPIPAPVITGGITQLTGDVTAGPGSGSQVATVNSSAVQAFPVGSVFISAVTTNPNTLLGYGTWSAVGAGQVLVGLNSGDPDFASLGQTGGSKTVASTGSVAAPTFTGSSATTSSVSGGTPSGTVSQPTFTGNSDTSSAVSAGTPAGTNNAPAFTGTPFSGVINHTHTITSTLTVQGGTTASNTGTHVMTSVATGGSARAVAAGDSIASSSANPAGGVSSITPAGTVAAPTFTGSALGTHTHTTTATGSVSQPTFTGSALSGHTHTLTATGTNSAPAYTGNATSVVQPYLVVYFWQRTA